MLVLSQSDLRDTLTISDCIKAVEAGFRALALEEASAPERLSFELPSREGVLLQMPAYIFSAGDNQRKTECALGTKVVTVRERNAEQNLDPIQAVYLLMDGNTGVSLALMDGRFITAIRTAATSALATSLMAAPGPKRLAVFGAGAQAKSHIEAMIEVCNVLEIFITSRSYDKALELAQFVKSKYQIACSVVLPDEAAQSANLICTCTNSPLPLFDGMLLKPGTHINAVGSFTASTRELDEQAVKRARVIIDAQSAAGREAGDILIPLSEGKITVDHIKGSLSDLVTGRVAGRKSASEITLFKSSGHAIADLVTARLAYDKAMSSGIGTQVSL